MRRSNSPYKLLNSKDYPLIFFEDPMDQWLQLYISYQYLKEIFCLAHDQENHHGIEKMYEKLIINFFASHLFRQIKWYITHCLKCAINRTLHHKPHDEIQSIQTPPFPFHMITINFILDLPSSRKFGHKNKKFNATMMTMNKFIKIIIILPGKDIYTTPK